jgi:O-antigen/teichoic acid export membrane protein
MFGYVNSYAILLLIEIFYTAYLKQLFIFPNFKNFDKKKVKEIAIFASFVILGSSSNMISASIDSLMIVPLTKDGLENVAFYSVALYIGVIIVTPYNSIIRIANSIISEHWKNNEIEKIDVIYKQTSNNLMLIGTLLFLGIWLNADNIFKILPEAYRGGKYVLLFVLFAKWYEISTGVNGSIIQFSNFFKMMLYFNGLLIALLIVTNYLLIPRYGITGAAFATLISIFVVNTIRLIIIKVKMDILPFTKKSILTPIIGLVTYFIVKIIPSIEPFYIDILMRSIIIIALFVPAVYLLKVSEEFNNLVDKTLKIIKLKK